VSGKPAHPMNRSATPGHVSPFFLGTADMALVHLGAEDGGTMSFGPLPYSLICVVLLLRSLEKVFQVMIVSQNWNCWSIPFSNLKIVLYNEDVEVSKLHFGGRRGRTPAVV